VARNFIKINRADTNAINAAELYEFATALRKTYELGIRIRDKMDHMNDGANFADVELYYGLTVGNGTVVYNMVKNTVDSLEGDLLSNDGKQLSERLG
jgi:hypothetical protein